MKKYLRPLCALLCAALLLCALPMYALAEDAVEIEAFAVPEEEALTLEIEAPELTEMSEVLEDIPIELSLPEPDGAAMAPSAANTGEEEEDRKPVPINEANFPDTTFRNYVKAHFDADGDGKLSAAEIDQAEEVYLRTWDDSENGVNEVNCSSLKGIEFLSSLDRLECVGCNLTSLDVSKNENLGALICAQNKLKKLDVSKNKVLRDLDCGGNQLSKLDVTKNKTLLGLWCAGNKLSKLDVTNNTKLTVLDCSDNKLSKLDVSRNKSLEELYCWRNQLTKLDVTKNTKLKNLDCSVNKLTKLDVTKNTKLTLLECSENKLSKLDVTKNSKLELLFCLANQLTALDVTKNKRLTLLFCPNNALRSLDVRKNTKLETLHCADNRLKALDVTNLKMHLRPVHVERAFGTKRILNEDNFTLDIIQPEGAARVPEMNNFGIITAIEGDLTLTWASGSMKMQPGDTFFLPASVPPLKLKGTGIAALAMPA